MYIVKCTKIKFCPKTEIKFTFLKSVWKKGFFDTPFAMLEETKFSSLRRANEYTRKRSIFWKTIFYKQAFSKNFTTHRNYEILSKSLVPYDYSPVRPDVSMNYHTLLRSLVRTILERRGGRGGGYVNRLMSSRRPSSFRHYVLAQRSVCAQTFSITNILKICIRLFTCWLLMAPLGHLRKDVFNNITAMHTLYIGIPNITNLWHMYIKKVSYFHRASSL
jgi:hypothetical protein